MTTLNVRLPTSGDSPSSTLSTTITIPELGKIKNIIADTGNVTYELLGNNQVKINVSNGNYVRRTYNSHKYSKYVTNQTSSNYSKDGYSGTLEKYLYSGSYTPGDSKTVNGQTSANYNKDGYSGTLDRYLYSGSYTPEDSKYVTNQTSSNYSKDGYSGTLEKYLYSGSYTPEDSKTVSRQYIGNILKGEEVDVGWSTRYYSSEGYSGTLTCISIDYYDQFGTGDWKATFSGTVTKPAVDTRVYRYKGTVTKPAVDTRVYRYKGTVYKGGYNYYYAYNVTIEYEENSKTYLKINGEYKKTFFYLKSNGIYIKISPYLKVNGEYQKI